MPEAIVGGMKISINDTEYKACRLKKDCYVKATPEKSSLNAAPTKTFIGQFKFVWYYMSVVAVIQDLAGRDRNIDCGRGSTIEEITPAEYFEAAGAAGEGI